MPPSHSRFPGHETEPPSAGPEAGSGPAPAAAVDAGPGVNDQLVAEGEHTLGRAGTAADSASLAEAATELVRALSAYHANHPTEVRYGHDMARGQSQRNADWWWDLREFDCSRFVLWVLARRKVDDSQRAGPGSVRINVLARTADELSSVTAMVDAARQIGMIQQGSPRVGDLMFWTGHVAIVVDVDDTTGPANTFC